MNGAFSLLRKWFFTRRRADDRWHIQMKIKGGASVKLASRTTIKLHGGDYE